MENIIKKLHWKQPEKIQNEGIKLAILNEDLSFILDYCNDPNYAHNCAKIFSLLPYEKTEKYFDRLFLWIVDLNNEGAQIIENYLMKAPAKLIYDYFIEMAKYNSACINKKDGTLFWSLLWIMQENQELYKMLDKDKLFLKDLFDEIEKQQKQS